MPGDSDGCSAAGLGWGLWRTSLCWRSCAFLGQADDSGQRYPGDRQSSFSDQRLAPSTSLMAGARAAMPKHSAIPNATRKDVFHQQLWWRILYAPLRGSVGLRMVIWARNSGTMLAGTREAVAPASTQDLGGQVTMVYSHRNQDSHENTANPPIPTSRLP